MPRNNRHVVPARRLGAGKTNANQLVIIIPAAGAGKRMRSYGVRSLLELRNGQTLIYRQLSILSEVYPKAEIVVIGGFEADKLYNNLPNHVRFVENENYETTNVVRSIGMGLRVASGAAHVLVAYGDLVFNAQAVDNLTKEGSAVVVDSQGHIDEDEASVAVVDGQVTNFAFGLPTKWAQVVYLTGRELDVFKTIAWNRNKAKLYGSEALNEIISRHGTFRAIENDGARIIEIDCYKDLEGVDF